MATLSNAQAQVKGLPAGVAARPNVRIAGDGPGLSQARPSAVAREPASEVRTVSLPLLATGADVRELVKSLKKKPTGITIVQALNSDQRRLFDERKLSAYKFWEILEQHEERLRLTKFGQEFARQLRQETEAYRTLLRRVEPYRAALRWVHDEDLGLVSFDIIASLWQRLYPQSEDLCDHNTAKGNVISFFHLCQSADLGVVTIGKRGQPARIRLDRSELVSWMQFDQRADEPRDLSLLEDVLPSLTAPQALGELSPGAETCVFISHREQAGLVRHVQELLDLIDARSIVTHRGGSAGYLMSRQTGSALRECQAAILIVGDADLGRDCDGRAVLDEQTRIELGAACALYDHNVFLLWQSGAPLPDELRDAHQCSLVENDLSLADGLHLMKGIKERRRSSVERAEH